MNRYEFQGRTSAVEQAHRAIERQVNNARKLRNRLLAASLMVPVGGFGALRTDTSHSAKPTPVYVARAYSESSTAFPPTTIFVRREVPSSITTSTSKPQEKTPQTTTKVTLVTLPPSSFDQIYIAAGARFTIPPQILYGLHFTESRLAGDGRLPNKQGSGAEGPMQFMPQTWAKYGVDGNGDGKIDIDNAADAIYGAANYLSSLPGSIEAKLRAYGANVTGTLEAARSKTFS